MSNSQNSEVEAPPALLELKGITHRFETPPDVLAKLAIGLGASLSRRSVHAVDAVDLTIGKAKIVGLVGESGCGKSTLGRIAAGLIRPTSGSVMFRGGDRSGEEPIVSPSLAIQMIFQDPFSSLNARMRVGDIISEAPLHHGLIDTTERLATVTDMLTKVGLDPGIINRYPHQFSGGQRQRLGIARALAVKPQILICDESIAALDVSIQAHILELFLRLRAELEISLLFISHDLGVVEYLSDEVSVMYLGRIVEQGTTEAVFSRPSHPYTRALIEEIPKLRGGSRRFATIKGEVPSPLSPPGGCHFHPRCPHATEECKRLMPKLEKVGESHYSACHLNK